MRACGDPVFSNNGYFKACAMEGVFQADAVLCDVFVPRDK